MSPEWIPDPPLSAVIRDLKLRRSYISQRGSGYADCVPIAICNVTADSVTLELVMLIEQKIDETRLADETDPETPEQGALR